MRIEKLSLNKIKVTVDFEDLSLYDLSQETLSPESPRLKAFILAIMKRAELETGFNASVSNVLIEAIAQGENIIFVITRIDASANKPQQVLTREQKLEKLKSNAYRVVKSNAAHTSEKQFYRFDSLETFVALLRVCTLPKTSVLYKSDFCYYLSLPCGSAKTKRISNLVTEFASAVDAKLLAIYLKEHAEVVARGTDFDKIAACFK